MENIAALYFHRLGDKGGGAERMVCQLAGALVTEGLTVHLITLDDAHSECFYPLNRGVIWHRLAFRPGAADKLRRTRALTKLLRQHRIQTLVGFVMSGDRTVYAAAKLSPAKLIAAERNAPEIYRVRYGFFQRWVSFACLHLADRIAVQFPDYAHGYPASLRDRMEVIPNPVPIANRHAHPRQRNAGGRFTLLCVGRLDYVQKRQQKLVSAFAGIAAHHPNWDLLLIGDGPERESLYTLGSKSGIAARLRIEPSRQDIFEAYTEAHLFALPSRWEGFPNSLAEALAHGLPAIGFRDAPGISQLIVDGENGWLAPGVDDEVSLGKCLNEAMDNDAERARRGTMATNSMLRFASEPAVKQWTRLIRDLC